MVPGGLRHAELLSGLTEGDPEAARTLYRSFGERVNRLVWNLLGADAEHDDMVQQVFVNILGSIHRLREPGALEAWIIRVTTNTVRKELRSRKQRRLFRLSDEPPEQSDSRLAPDRRMLVRSFYRVLNAMRTGDRLVFTLRHVGGLSLTETAAACGVSETTAKRRLRRARERFYKRASRDFVLADVLEELTHNG